MVQGCPILVHTSSPTRLSTDAFHSASNNLKANVNHELYPQTNRIFKCIGDKEYPLMSSNSTGGAERDCT